MESSNESRGGCETVENVSRRKRPSGESSAVCVPGDAASDRREARAIQPDPVQGTAAHALPGCREVHRAPRGVHARDFVDEPVPLRDRPRGSSGDAPDVEVRVAGALGLEDVASVGQKSWRLSDVDPARILLDEEVPRGPRRRGA